GAVPFALLGTERITTANNCVPRDMIVIGGDRFLLGYNVRMGLKTETNLADVFTLYSYRDRQFREEPLDLLRSGEFERDFKELYKYYRGSTFSAFRIIGPYLYMAFQVGATATDLKTFKWSLDNGALAYLGNRADHEFAYPPQHEFEWRRAVRDFHRLGANPHVSIDDRIFVECIHGDLTVKLEDNTDTGEGIYSEPVENRDQTLDDAEIHYALVGALILLKIRPFQEKEFRYLVFSEKLRTVRRIDDIAKACVLLPDDHGIIFAHGYFLQTGEYKLFDNEFDGMVYAGCCAAPNGEDFLYDFLNRETGVDILLSYNRIARKVQTPIVCNGFATFDSGEMVLFRCDDQPQKHHALQVWQTPYVGRNVVPAAAQTDSFLYKIGSATVVNALAECHELLTLCGKDDSYAGLYTDLVRQTATVLDTYFWLGDAAAGNLREPLDGIRATAAAAIEEFEKVTRLKRTAAAENRRLRQQVAERIRAIDYYALTGIDVFVGHLAALRGLRGGLVTAREVRYIDLAALAELEQEIVTHSDKLSGRCVQFLLGDAALAPYAARAEEFRAQVAQVATGREATALAEAIGGAAGELEMLIEIVGTLKIDDATQTTAIVDRISTIYAALNQVKSLVQARRRDLAGTEGAAQFAAQLKLLAQAVTNYLDLAGDAAKCDEYLTKLMVQLEELEGTYADFDEFIPQLAAKREEIYSAFSARKVQLTEARQRRGNALAETAERILTGIRHRAAGFTELDGLNAYFAADLMIDKVRDTAAKLTAAEDTVRAEDILGRLKTIQQDAVRQLKDKLELYVDGANIIRFGRHNFAVNTQPLDLTMVLRDGEMHYHLSGTRYFEPVQDAEFLATRAVWAREVVAESPTVYRAEYLAYGILVAAAQRGAAAVAAWRAHDPAARLEAVRAAMAARHAEGYVKGVHDADAARLLGELLRLHAELRRLRFAPAVRALARLWWEDSAGAEEKRVLGARLRSRGAARRQFPGWEDRSILLELRDGLATYADAGWCGEASSDAAAEYLAEELGDGDRFVVSSEAAALANDCLEALRQRGALADFTAAREAVKHDRRAAWCVIRDWLAAFLTAAGNRHDPAFLDEAAGLLLAGGGIAAAAGAASATVTLSGMVGTHPVIAGGSYQLNYHGFMQKLERFAAEDVPAFTRCLARKQALLAQRRAELRLQEFTPRVLTTFVRNRLIDQFYLPLLGANLAKQVGTTGADKRTDRMGLLLLISPPGYGKTTLIEYIANRLGTVFMKINGPALGPRVTSLDPAEAPNAAAREEISKLNLALEMGDNVMLCIDDIQHTSPEFLQKFISLCDAQRKIEGVFRGQPRTYDLRGRKVMVVMAGNPYTESGARFVIPDMLANRADTYNLGDVVSNNEDIFRESYLENAVTANAILARLGRASQQDVQAVIQLAQSGRGGNVDFTGNYAPEELNEMVEVMRRLIRIRDVVYRVNQEYIRSAGTAEAYRTEPAFKLQGSYRNMNRLAEKVLPVMTDAEIDDLIFDHYKSEAQTLTTGAESNLLKFRELTGKLAGTDADRWAEIRCAFKRNLLAGTADADDPV
ncbi:MAG TPA: DNA repair ATPase, partial [bacterium]|nr:DNA repair ATPase [bacterium]